MSTATATGQRINYEVVWGPDAEDRILYVDYGDGTWLSCDAEVRAVRKLLELTKDGVRVGLFENGVLTGGQEPIFPEPEPEPVVHKTRCTQGSVPIVGSTRYAWDGSKVEQYGWLASAYCSCGWSWHTSDITTARCAARHHRESATT